MSHSRNAGLTQPDREASRVFTSKRTCVGRSLTVRKVR